MNKSIVMQRSAAKRAKKALLKLIDSRKTSDNPISGEVNPLDLLTQEHVNALPHGTFITVIFADSHTGIAWPSTVYVDESGVRWAEAHDTANIIELNDVGRSLGMTRVRLG